MANTAQYQGEDETVLAGGRAAKGPVLVSVVCRSGVARSNVKTKVGELVEVITT